MAIRQASSRKGELHKDEYDKKTRELKGRQTELALWIEQHQEGEGHYRTTLESLISVASRAAEIFERSKTDAEARVDRFRLFEPASQGEKARVFIAFAVRPDGQPGRSA